MSTAASKQLELFAVRSCEIADRCHAGELPFIEAVDMAYSAAIWSGLADDVGDDNVQKILAAAFTGARKEEK